MDLVLIWSQVVSASHPPLQWSPFFTAHVIQILPSLDLSFFTTEVSLIPLQSSNSFRESAVQEWRILEILY